MSLPSLKRTYAISKLTAAQLGTPSKNSRDLLVQVKNALVESGQWSVTRSCDGTTIAAGDLWTDWTKIVGLGDPSGHYSWLTMRNDAQGVEYSINVTVTGSWTEVLIWCSASVGFTGGTNTGTYPSASDAYQVTNPVGADWLGTGPAPAPDADPQFRAFTWASTDGAETRVAWWYKGKLCAFWQFDAIANAAGGTWKPWLSLQWDGGNDYVNPSSRMTLNQFTFFPSKKVRTNTNNVEDVGVFFEEWGSTAFVDAFPQNQRTSQYLWQAPIGLNVAGVSPPRNGPIGYMTGMWWVGSTAGPTPVFADGDTADGGAWIFVGQMMLPWDGTLTPPTGGAGPFTDRSADVFFGRDAGECSCGPDDCDTDTTSLITLRNGAKELADKVNDASVSDTTWNLWVNQGIEDLWKRIVEATGDAFLSTYDFTLVGGSAGNTFDVTTIPAKDFRRVRMIEVNPGSSSRRRIKPFNFTEKDNGAANIVSRVWDTRRRYRRMGNLIYIERYEFAAGMYRLYYVPKAAKLELTCDALPPVLDEWAEYPQVFAAMKALGKEESDPGYLPTRLQELRDDIAALKGDPDEDADNIVIADVEDSGEGGDWP